MRIGAHVSAAGGITNAIDRIRDIGGNCLQIFISPPQGWRKTEITDETAAAFKAGVAAYQLGPVFIHALYLVNLATANPELREKTIDALAHALTTADRIGAQGVIYHTGSATTRQDDIMADVVSAMREILKRASGTGQLIIETAAGKTVGAKFEDVALMRERAGSDRVKVCFDTCHAFAAGHDLRTPPSIEATLKAFDATIGLEHLVVVHANDSKFALGEGRDRHENIGEGHIGTEAFRALLHAEPLRKLPWILEVPGFDDKGPDAKNIKILTHLSAA